MTKEEVLSQVNDIFNDVLDDAVVLNYDSSASTIEEWDSLTHIQLVVAIEKHFKQKFTSAEIQTWKNVGEMCESLVNKVN